LDIAKHIFQAHGADGSGAVIFRKKLRRAQVLAFFAAQPPCIVAMEACGSAHHWGREISRLGHAVRLIPPAYVKPFVKRQKNEAADAEALVFRTRDLLVQQRTQVINAVRGHLSEFGIVVAKGAQNSGLLAAQVEEPASGLPEPVRGMLGILIEELRRLNERIAELDREVMRRAKANATARRLMTIPGIGPVTAMALVALAPAAATFKRGRDFAAWLGLTPQQRSSGGKERLGRITKQGERMLRRLLIIGASAVARWAARNGAAPGSWLERMLSRKPPMLVRVALANKMARTVWALLAHGGVYQAPAAAA
jgi:transposase